MVTHVRKYGFYKCDVCKIGWETEILAKRCEDQAPQKLYDVNIDDYVQIRISNNYNFSRYVVAKVIRFETVRHDILPVVKMLNGELQGLTFTVFGDEYKVERILKKRQVVIYLNQSWKSLNKEKEIIETKMKEIGDEIIKNGTED